MSDTIEQVIERLEHASSSLAGIASVYPEDLRALLAERDRLREALEWYANRENHTVQMERMVSDIEVDNGKRARAALEKKDG